MVEEGGTFTIPVLINGILPLHFTVDNCATDVTIPEDVVTTLMRTGTLRSENFLDSKTYQLADGSTIRSKTFRVRTLRVGNRVVEDVIGSMANRKGCLLLGQSFLGRFARVAFD